MWTQTELWQALAWNRQWSYTAKSREYAHVSPFGSYSPPRPSPTPCMPQTSRTPHFVSLVFPQSGILAAPYQSARPRCPCTTWFSAPSWSASLSPSRKPASFKRNIDSMLSSASRCPSQSLTGHLFSLVCPAQLGPHPAPCRLLCKGHRARRLANCRHITFWSLFWFSNISIGSGRK